MTEPPHNWDRHESRARKLLKDPQALRDLAGRGAAKLDGAAGAGRLAAVRAELLTLLALLRAYASGAYREVSGGALLSIAAAIVYFVSPLDAIPDFILGLGLIDDVAIIGYVLQQVRSELEAFRRWQEVQTGHDDDAPP
ncbi:MAG: YkvA family protein [Pseudomonadota bacterium]